MCRIDSVESLEQVRQEIRERVDPSRPWVAVCAGAGCLASGAAEVIAAFRAELEARGLTTEVTTRGTGCPGFCERGPIVVIHPEQTCYLQVKAEDVAEIVESSIVNHQLVERLLYLDPESGERVAREADIPYYKHQQRNILSANSRIDSKSLDDYLAIDGYAALAKALHQMSPDEIMEQIKASNLRGRGGGGFPVWRKWAESRNAADETRYVIVNADEGDPGAFMDRALIEGNPHSILEGLIIGAYAVGAHQGFIYVRQEYPLAVENINLAIAQAEERGLLGQNIRGSGVDFSIQVHMGAGAFVCGESSALMTAIEGRAGEPRPKYIHTAVKGIWDRPSVLNNVETWANVPQIISRGADWFRQFGTDGSTGTKLFSLVGKINNTGLVEVPMGISLRQIIDNVGGGIPDDRHFKAVQTGGPSGGCVPEDQLDLPVDFDALTKAGSMMGSGGMIVMDETTCMVDIARYFLDFLQDESCGKCTPCREGIRQMLKILDDITSGRGREGDIERLEEIAETTQVASLCALGKGAPNPVLSTIRYFRAEYEAHINQRVCPALSCKELIHFEIDPQLCKACGTCFKQCPAVAIEGGKKQVHVIDQAKCTRCGTCFDVCPKAFGAVQKLPGAPVEDKVAEPA